MAEHGDAAAELSAAGLDEMTTNSTETEEAADDGASENTHEYDRRRSPVTLAIIAGLVFVTALAGLVGWMSYRTHQTSQSEQQRRQFLDAGRQAALNLTTIDYNEVDKDISRILNSATGQFLAEFQKRSQPFVEAVKQGKSISHGTVSEAGIESIDTDHAQVLVAVQVKTSVDGSPDAQPRGWRMRIAVQRVGGEVKVADVQFVP